MSSIKNTSELSLSIHPDFYCPCGSKLIFGKKTNLSLFNYNLKDVNSKFDVILEKTVNKFVKNNSSEILNLIQLFLIDFKNLNTNYSGKFTDYCVNFFFHFDKNHIFIFSVLSPPSIDNRPHILFNSNLILFSENKFVSIISYKDSAGDIIPKMKFQNEKLKSNLNEPILFDFNMEINDNVIENFTNFLILASC